MLFREGRKEYGVTDKRFVSVLVLLSFVMLGLLLLFTKNKGSLPVIKAKGGSGNGYAIYTKDGDIFYTGKIEKITRNISGSQVIQTEGASIGDPVGIVEDPPEVCITDIYSKVLKHISKGEDTLVIYLDGLGYEDYEKALAAGSLPFISSQGTGVQALTVYPSITDVTFASMVTGKTPRYTGIHDREKKPLKVQTIFDAAALAGKTSKLIEGNMRIIIDEVDTVLNIDENKNGTIDDEIFNCAMKELVNPPGLLLVHFHSFDDFGHEYGPESKEAMAQLAVLDSYLESMLKGYDGHVIITADHGMHADNSGGSHGSFSASDMFIPIIEVD